MQAIKDAGREDLLDCDAVVIPAWGFDVTAIWFDDSYNTMIQAGGEWIKPADGVWLDYAKERIQGAGFAWFEDFGPQEPDPTPPTPAGHTPGPWNVTEMSEQDRHGRTCNKIESYDKTLGFVAHVYAKQSREEQEANAALIAAAPELFQALKALIAHPTTAEVDCDEAQRHGHALNAARAAIAKAEGVEL